MHRDNRDHREHRDHRDRDRESSPEGSEGFAPSQSRGYAERDGRDAAARDPTLVAMAGANAQHFVPEKLPWQVLRNITRVLQVCWFWSGLMAFLKEVHVYQVDFQQHPAHERRLCEAKVWPFDQMAIDWPHGSFFRPQGLLCPEGQSFLVASPFAVYAAAPVGAGESQGSSSVRLDEVWRGRLPAVGSACAGSFAQCLLFAPAEGRIEVWRPGHPRSALALEDQAPWLRVAGSITTCKQVATLLPEEASADFCLLLAGWDGRLIPVAAVPLAGHIEEEGGLHLEPTKLQPGLDAPLQDASKAVAALHMERGGLLWALLVSGDVEAWDLLSSRSLGRWRARFSDASFQPIAMCQDSTFGFLVLGHNVTGGGAIISRAQRPADAESARLVL